MIQQVCDLTSQFQKKKALYCSVKIMGERTGMRMLQTFLGNQYLPSTEYCLVMAWCAITLLLVERDLEV